MPGDPQDHRSGCRNPGCSVARDGWSGNTAYIRSDRALSHVPVIMLSVKSSELDKEAGNNDFLIESIRYVGYRHRGPSPELA